MNRRQYKNLKPGDTVYHQLSPNKVWEIIAVDEKYCTIRRALSYGNNKIITSEFDAKKRQYYQLITRQNELVTSR